LIAKVNNLQTIGLILNSIGLILDIVGAYKLYKTSSKGLDTIAKPPNITPIITSTFFHESLSEKKGEQLVNDLINELNRVIKSNNEINEQSHKRSFLWFVFLLVGFIFQLVGAILPVFGCNS